jgi:hypothetical protein
MKWNQTFCAVLIGLCTVSCYPRDETRTTPSLIFTNVAPVKSDKQWPIYEDSILKMVAVGYGDASRKSKPGFFVFRKATADWIRIDRVSTRGGTFGRNPTFQEVKDAEKTPPSIGWDFRSLAVKDYVDFPLTSTGFLFFPDKVEYDEKQKQYVIRFNSGWGIKGVETVLRFPIDAVKTKNHKQIPTGDDLKSQTK